MCGSIYGKCVYVCVYICIYVCCNTNTNTTTTTTTTITTVITTTTGAMIVLPSSLTCSGSSSNGNDDSGMYDINHYIILLVILIQTLDLCGWCVCYHLFASYHINDR